MFDLDIIMPVCDKFSHRLDDFRRYGLVNCRDRSVRINLISSGERLKGVEEGWPPGVTARLIYNESREYVANLYRFYLSVDPDKPEAKWLVRLDDDSCTDVDGLVSNLDLFYGCDNPFYLGDLHPFQEALNGYEGGPYPKYSRMLGDHERIAPLIRIEIECGIMSRGAMPKVLGNERSRALIEKRTSLEGGYGDCVVGLACALVGVYPTDCPFITHQPLVHEFSLFGGPRNHIHMVSRLPEAENFWYRATPENFNLLVKAIENQPTEKERMMLGRRLLLENDSTLQIVTFREGYTAEIKLDRRRFNWYESEGEILILDGGSVFNRIMVEDDGSMSCHGFAVSEI